MELQELRNEINRIDGEMLALLERRLAVCRGIAECKRGERPAGAGMRHGKLKSCTKRWSGAEQPGSGWWRC